MSAGLNLSAKEWFDLLDHKVFTVFLMIKTGFVKISVLKTSSLFPIRHLVLIPSPAHRSDHSTIIQASITQF